MAKKVIVSTSFWHKQKINKLYSKDATLVIGYLICNPKVTRTGIYTIFSEEIASGLGRNIIDAEEVRVALRELENAKVIRYEHNADVVYILDFRQFSSFDSGKPSIIARELLADFDEIDEDSKAVQGFWFDYVQQNQEQLLAFENRLQKSKSNSEKLSIKPIINLILPN